jgi:site-specific DNA-methyltransferase (adenine-specific)/adenine-specific DNA-methyltransferase
MIYRTDDSQHTIYQGDVLEKIKEIPNGSVDLIFADPPYNIGKDFDGLKEDWAEQDFLNWVYEWIDECYRVLSKNGTFYFMNSTENMPYLDIYCRNKFNIASRIIWSYDSSGVQAKRYYGSLYEPILMLTKGKTYTFNYEDIMVEAKTGAQRKLMDYRKNPPQPYNTKKVPGNVWEFSRVRFKMEEYENHPTQKPEALLERIIKASSNEGDVILDPFSGSFSTCAVAKRLKRKTIGIEVNPEYVKIGLRRVGIPSHYPEDKLKKYFPMDIHDSSVKVMFEIFGS